MDAQQAVAKRSVGRRVNLFDAPFFCLHRAPPQQGAIDVAMTAAHRIRADAVCTSRCNRTR
jgi:hypothetical protein